ncbi:MAG: hypothetical protein M3138_07000 [Actinomycetota bacterium]|nr:hypothetical protein [Actinomycetota bacterium]
MSRRRAARTVLVGLVTALLIPAAARVADAAAPVSVTVDRARISTELGHGFGFRSTITNRGSTAASGLIAHLNVLSLRDGVYVDPEDWSSQRTYYLDPIAAGASTTITWRMQAVNGGSFGVYVAVLPESGPAPPPTTGSTIHVAVAERRTLNSRGILPLALGVPALLGLVTLGFRLRRRY